MGWGNLSRGVGISGSPGRVLGGAPEMSLEGWPLMGRDPSPPEGWGGLQAGFRGWAATLALAVDGNQLLGHAHRGHVISGAEAAAGVAVSQCGCTLVGSSTRRGPCQSPGLFSGTCLPTHPTSASSPSCSRAAPKRLTSSYVHVGKDTSIQSRRHPVHFRALWGTRSPTA